MVGLRTRPRGAWRAPFGLAALAIGLLPSPLGEGGSAGHAQRHAPKAERWDRHAANPVGTMRAATFNFRQPIGSAIPVPLDFDIAAISVREGELSSVLPARLIEPERAAPPLDDHYPSVDRRHKGDRLIPAARDPAQVDWPLGPIAPDAAVQDTPLAEPSNPAGALPDEEAALTQDLQDALLFEPFPEYDVAMSLELDPQVPAADAVDTTAWNTPLAATPPDTLLSGAEESEMRLYFGAAPMGSSFMAMERWTPGEEPRLLLASAPADPDLKPAKARTVENDRMTGESIAPKGEVTGEGRRPKSPAERLALVGTARAKAEKCLANAVYFEARSEPVRGQIAVAQVVLNRAFSGYYPDDVCSVVYQNAHRHLACQFTFACDGIRDVVTDRESWARAMRIAKSSLDGKIWLSEIGRATHYHAAYVSPYWVRSMKKHHRVGLHTFYRPRQWGDGSDAPRWGSASLADETSAKM